MKRSRRYMQSRDIDWFFRSSGNLIHCASNGGLLPEIVADIDYLESSGKIVAAMEDVITDDRYIFINKEHVDAIVREQLELIRSVRERTEFDDDWLNEVSIRSNYLDTFVKMARKGIWSYDRVGGEDGSYVLVARPGDANVKPDFSLNANGFVKMNVLVENEGGMMTIPQCFFKSRFFGS